MALRGTLNDFGIAEIFQLIGGQGKSGILYLESKKGKLKLSFDKGAIVDVEAGTRHRSGSLGDLLVRAEICTPAQIKEAIAIQKKTLRRLPDILREQGFVSDPEVLNEMIALETNEALYELFTWQDGTYRFEPTEVQYDPKVSTPRSLEHFLMEGFRRIDEWPIIERRVGSFDTHFQVVAPLPTELSDESGCRRVFSLIRPDRNVSQLVDVSRLGEFETGRALQYLLDHGCIRAVSEKPVRRKRERPASGPVFSLRVTLELLAKGLVSLSAIVLIVVLLWYANPNLSALLRAPADGTLGRGDLRALLGNGQLARIREAIEVYRLETGKYPARLEDLATARLVTAEELRYPWDREYFYQGGERIVLHRPSR